MAQTEVRVQDLYISRIDPTSVTTPPAREEVLVSDSISKISILEVVVDAVAGTAAAIATIPDHMYVLDTYFKVTSADFAGGTSIQLGNGTVDFLTAAVGITASLTAGDRVRGTSADQTFIDAVTANKEIDLTVVGTYTVGTGILTLVLIDTK